MANGMKVPLMMLKGMQGVPVFLKREKMPTYSIRNLRKKYVLIYSWKFDQRTTGDVSVKIKKSVHQFKLYLIEN